MRTPLKVTGLEASTHCLCVPAWSLQDSSQPPMATVGRIPLFPRERCCLSAPQCSLSWPCDGGTFRFTRPKIYSFVLIPLDIISTNQWQLTSALRRCELCYEHCNAQLISADAPNCNGWSTTPNVLTPNIIMVYHKMHQLDTTKERSIIPVLSVNTIQVLSVLSKHPLALPPAAAGQG